MDGCKWRQAAFEWKTFLFVGNHLDNKIEAGTFTLKNHTGNCIRIIWALPPLWRKSWMSWLTGCPVDRLTLTKDGVTKCRSVSRRNPVELEDLPGVIDIYCRGRATRLKFTSKQDLVWISGRLEGKQWENWTPGFSFLVFCKQSFFYWKVKEIIIITHTFHNKDV